MPGTREAGAGGAAPGRGPAAAAAWLHGPGRRRQWRRRVVRRVLAMACAMGAALGFVAISRSADAPHLVRVVVAVRPLAVGEVASPGSLREVWWPADLAPESSIHSFAEVIGRPLAVPLGPGEPVTRTRVNHGSLLAGQPADAVAVHVSLPDAGALAMVSAGDRVDLWSPTGVVARGVVVLRVDKSLPTDFGAAIQGQGSSSGYATEANGIIVSAGQEVARRVLSVPEDALGRPQIALVLRHALAEPG
jgi:hypothetical protein